MNRDLFSPVGDNEPFLLVDLGISILAVLVCMAVAWGFA